MGQIPGPKADEIAHPAAAVALLENADGFVLQEEPEIRRQHVEVRVRQQVAAEVGHIVPDVQLRRNTAPGLDVSAEPSVRLRVGFQGLGEVALYAAQPNDHVVPRAHVLGRRTRVLVCQRLHQDIGEVLFRLLGYGIHEVDEALERRPPV